MRDKDRLIYLVSVTTSYDSIGQPVRTEKLRPVYARIRSVSLTEWSTANQLGLSAGVMSIMWTFEYSGEEFVVVGDKRYHVYRTYDTGDRIELYLEEAVGHGS